MLMEEVIQFKFIPSIAGEHICSNDKPVCYHFLQDWVDLEFCYSMKKYVFSLKTREGSHQYIDWFNERPISTVLRKRIWTTIKTERENIHKSVLNTLQNRSNSNQLRLNFINSEEGVLSWLTPYPISGHGFDLTKQQFWYCLRLRYDWVLPNMPSTCCCSAKIGVQHVISCKRGFNNTT